MPVEIEQLRTLAQRLAVAVEQGSQEDLVALRRLEGAAEKVGLAWSGSSLGYHSVVYYRDFTHPPAEAGFSPEWGLRGRISGTVGDWVEYRYFEVIKHIERMAGDPDLAEVELLRDQCAEEFSSCRSEYCAIASEYLEDAADAFVDDLRGKAEGLQISSIGDAIRDQLPAVKPFTQDPRAMSAELSHSPHHEVLARVLVLRSPFTAAKRLKEFVEQTAGRLERVSKKNAPRSGGSGQSVFIGHGGSGEWWKLSDFIQNRLGLRWDEFNRVPVAGLSTVQRLEEMLDNAAMAFVVMTAEDEMADGGLRARENVVHEAGLFQGRLGFTRAVLVAEEGCGKFSNIHGLGLITFPAGRLELAFESVRSVLEREGLVRAGR